MRTSTGNRKNKKQAKIRKVANKTMLPIHCISHHEHLATQKLPLELNDVMIQAVNIINYICDRVLLLRHFEVKCVTMAAQNCYLIFYAEVIWLSRGRVLPLLFELREEVNQFLSE